MPSVVHKLCILILSSWFNNFTIIYISTWQRFMICVPKWKKWITPTATRSMLKNTSITSSKKKRLSKNNLKRLSQGEVLEKTTNVYTTSTCLSITLKLNKKRAHLSMRERWKNLAVKLHPLSLETLNLKNKILS